MCDSEESDNYETHPEIDKTCGSDDKLVRSAAELIRESEESRKCGTQTELEKTFAGTNMVNNYCS